VLSIIAFQVLLQLDLLFQAALLYQLDLTVSAGAGAAVSGCIALSVSILSLVIS